MRLSTNHDRAGITLLEVLISLGILSVGLASVVALIPAGGSEARKALIEDRRGALGAAALNDIITRGALDPAKWSSVPATPDRYRLVFDPLGNGVFPAAAAGLTSVTLGNVAAGSVAASEVFRGQDDLVYDITQSEDDPPVPVFFGGAKRASEGHFSWLATLVPASSGTNPQYFRLTVVEFHRRDIPSGTSVGEYVFANPTIDFGAGLAYVDFRRRFPVGSVVLVTDAATNWEWRRVVMAAPTERNDAGDVLKADLTFHRDIPAESISALSKIFVFEGSVGYAERVLTLERTSPWSQ